MSTDVTDPPADPPVDPPVPKAPSIPIWTRGDLNAFFGLGFNILVNVLTLTGLMIGVIAVPPTDVLGTVLPALGVALILGNLYYTFLARRLARRENRTDVTALPYGPSVPHMFIVIFVVMLPVYPRCSARWQAFPSRSSRCDRRRRCGRRLGSGCP
jgi:AGZA family xanthine/uracil permease-like MFS transporter